MLVFILVRPTGVISCFVLVATDTSGCLDFESFNTQFFGSDPFLTGHNYDII